MVIAAWEVKGFAFVPMNQDLSRTAVFVNERAPRLILWLHRIRHCRT
jgi:hypothetical protein